MTEMTDLDLLGQLGVEAKPEKKNARTPREERIIAGFEEIQKFVEENGHPPAHGEDKDIFERLYATRLDQIRKQAECRELVNELDYQDLLVGDFETNEVLEEDIDDDELLSQLGVGAVENDVTELKHVRTRSEIRAAEEIANRTKCEDYEKFKPLFDAVRNDIDTGVRETNKFRKDAGFLKTDIKVGQFFILGGQTAIIASVGDTFKAPNGENDARLRVIYSNGTESNILLRSIIRALYKDDASRLISDPIAGPLFSGIVESDDLSSGTIYVLRSLSDNPMIKERRDVIHKIGVTGGDVKKRIANAKHEATYLLADVEVVATYKLANINRTKMENLLHKIFDRARIDIEIKDRFGNPVKPREWFLAPLFIINEVIDKIREGSITNYKYNIKEGRLEEKK
tara:strand:- start:901 stop:2097 length:1197 start_codon:yes stop_codon:yes gene_type:complete